MRYMIKNNVGKTYSVVDTKHGLDVVATFFNIDLVTDVVALLNLRDEAVTKFMEGVTKDIVGAYGK